MEYHLQHERALSDKGGRYIIAQGSLLPEKPNLINIYGPNMNDPKFYDNLFLTISTLPGQYIIAGNFNYALDPSKDRTSGTDLSHPKSRKTLHHFMRELN